MAQRRGRSWGPVIAPAVILAVMVLLAVLIGSGVWMTAALVVGLVALMFLVIAIASRLPTRRG